jgi:hypothetical protein
MRTGAIGGIIVSAWLVLPAGVVVAQGAKPLEKCPDDAVVSGTVCMDKYEASVWRVPVPTTINKDLVTRIRQGRATAADLQKGGARQLGVVHPDYAPCDEGGQFCADDIFAVSLPGVLPSANITWFQAQAACKNARKRLPSNAEWQAAAAGTNTGPDDHGSTCNTDAGVGASTVPTGSRASCVSTDLAFDMVGNLSEWVADWVPRSNSCPGWGKLQRRLHVPRARGERRSGSGRVVSRRRLDQRHGRRRLRGGCRLRSVARDQLHRLPVRPLTSSVAALRAKPSASQSVPRLNPRRGVPPARAR